MKPLQTFVLFALVLFYIDPLDAGSSSQAPEPKLPDLANVTLHLVSDYTYRTKFENLVDYLYSMQMIFNNVFATLLQLDINLRLQGITWLTENQEKYLFALNNERNKLNPQIAQVTLSDWIKRGQIDSISRRVDIVAFLFSVPFTPEYAKGFSRRGGACDQLENPALAFIRDADATFLVDIPLSQHILRLLGCDFDGEDKSEKCGSSLGRLMSKSFSEKPYTPSECTKKEVYESLKTKIEKGCFRNPGEEQKTNLTSLAGEMATMKRLCISYHESKKDMQDTVEVCKQDTRLTYLENHHDDECMVLCCNDGKVSYRKRELNGIHCTSSGKFCINGECVDRKQWKEKYLPPGAIEVQPHRP